ncbi:MAG: glycosyltransferase, partial [Phycisphaeraceae bacterium]
TAWLDEELASFRYLVVGLIDEQVRVAQVVPEGLSEEESSAFGERLTWHDSRWRLVRRHRLSRLAEPLGALGVMLLHALDGRVWEGTLRLAHRLNCAAVFGAGSALDVAQVAHMGRVIDPTRMAFAAATAPLAKAIRQRLDPQVIVDVIPTGVHVPDELPGTASRADPEALCAVITGNGQFDADYLALFTALPAILADYPQAQFFLDGMGSDQHQLWQAARRLDLLSNLSLIPRRLGHRELLLRADVLIHPQALARSRSLTLRAMAHGLPVLARQDRWLDYLIDGQTAWVVDRCKPEPWGELIRRLLDDPQAASTLGRGARQWVQQHRLAATQVEQMRQLYRRATGESLKFPQDQ